MISKKLLELDEKLDFDYTLVSVELDTAPNRLRYLSSIDLSDALQKDSFDKFYSKVKTEENVVLSFSDNTDLYEISGDCLVIILHETARGKFIIFDIQDAKKIENLVLNPNKENRQLL